MAPIKETNDRSSPRRTLDIKIQTATSNKPGSIIAEFTELGVKRIDTLTFAENDSGAYDRYYPRVTTMSRAWESKRTELRLDMESKRFPKVIQGLLMAIYLCSAGHVGKTWIHATNPKHQFYVPGLHVRYVSITHASSGEAQIRTLRIAYGTGEEIFCKEFLLMADLLVWLGEQYSLAGVDRYLVNGKEWMGAE